MESLKSVKKMICTIERAHGIEHKLKLKRKLQHQQQHRLKQGGKLDGTNDEKEETASKTVSSNLCGLHNREHEQRDRPTNPNSAKYNGIHFSTIRKQKQAKKEKAEADTKKEVNVIMNEGTTPTVSFKADFEYQTNDGDYGDIDDTF